VTITITHVNEYRWRSTTPPPRRGHAAIHSTPGVLTNDLDSDGDAFHGILAGQPAHARWTLMAMASFNYLGGRRRFTPVRQLYLIWPRWSATSEVAHGTITSTNLNDSASAWTHAYTWAEDTLLSIAPAPGVPASITPMWMRCVEAPCLSPSIHGNA